MTSIESTRSAILEYLTGFTSSKSSVVARLQNARTQSDNSTTELVRSLLSSEDDEEFDYGISLKSFKNLNSYITVMNSIYGNTSQSKFKTALNNVLNAGQNSQITNAKTFIEKMRENGLTNSGATKVLKAVNSYSLVSTMQNNNINSFVSAKA